ncbi:UNKNOWN [Stylonychia lemnae]|uniref:Uncharacterized protein n=1 Tax=Stylonychia lemnae TaxID=5949 RepID=A0A078AWQ6_STYLE|nr:UNKNOWN [Stylonychia lemnae]|eukprot:CDW86481.1 UNKNOWN [Stylonychia lemnae]
MPELNIIEKLSVDSKRIKYMNNQIQKSIQLQQSNDEKKMIQQSIDSKQDQIQKMKSYLEKVRELNRKLDANKPKPEELYQMRRNETRLLFFLNSLRLFEDYIEEKDLIIKDQEDSAIQDLGQTDISDMNDILEFNQLKQYRTFLNDAEDYMPNQIGNSPKERRNTRTGINQNEKRKTTLIKFPTFYLKKVNVKRTKNFNESNQRDIEAAVFSDIHVLNLWKEFKEQIVTEDSVIKHYDVSMMRLYSNTLKYKNLNTVLDEKHQIKDILQSKLQKIRNLIPSFSILMGKLNFSRLKKTKMSLRCLFQMIDPRVFHLQGALINVMKYLEKKTQDLARTKKMSFMEQKQEQEFLEVNFNPNQRPSIKKSTTQLNISAAKMRQNQENLKKIKKQLENFQYISRETLTQRVQQSQQDDDQLRDCQREEMGHLDSQRSFVKDNLMHRMKHIGHKKISQSQENINKLSNFQRATSVLYKTILSNESNNSKNDLSQIVDRCKLTQLSQYFSVSKKKETSYLKSPDQPNTSKLVQNQYKSEQRRAMTPHMNSNSRNSNDKLITLQTICDQQKQQSFNQISQKTQKPNILYQIPTKDLLNCIASTRNTKFLNQNIFNNSGDSKKQAKSDRELNKAKQMTQLDIIKEILSREDILKSKRDKSVGKLKEIYGKKNRMQMTLLN